MLHRGLSQSERIIIEKCSLSERIMRKSIRDRLASGVRIKEIWIRDEGVLTLFSKTRKANDSSSAHAFVESAESTAGITSSLAAKIHFF